MPHCPRLPTENLWRGLGAGRWLALGASVVAALGCGSGQATLAARGQGAESAATAAVRAASPEVARRTGATGDVAAALAAQLPRGADRCVVGALHGLSAKQRQVLAGVSGAPSWLWHPELQVEAFATASRERRGHLSRVTLLRGAWTLGQWRELLTAHSGLQIALAGEGGASAAARCSPDSCPALLEAGPAGTVVLQQGPWRAVPGRVGVEADCRRLLRDHGPTVEVIARRGAARAAAELVPFLHSQGVVSQGDGGLRAERVDTLPSPEVARAVMVAGLSEPLFRWRFELPQELAGEVTRRADGAHLRTAFDAPWSSLRMLVEDAERLQRAKRQAQALGKVAPTGAAESSQLDALVREVHYAVEAMRHAFGAPRRELALALRSRLEAAVAVHPGRRDLARLLATVLLEELDDGAAAVALAQSMANVEGADQAFWAQAERHGVALSAPKQLAQRLRSHGIASRRSSRLLAPMIATGIQRGASYDDAERAALAALSMQRRGRAALRPLPDEYQVAPDVLLDGLLLLARQQRGSSRLWLTVEGASLPELGPTAFVRLRQEASPLQLARLVSGDGVSARELGQALTRVPPGPVALSFAPGHEDGPGDAVLRLQGQLAAGLLTVTAVAPGASAAAWPDLVAILLEPLLALQGGQLRVSFEGEPEARAARDLAQGAFGLRCQLDRQVRTSRELAAPCEPGTAGCPLVLQCDTAASGHRLAREALSAVRARPLRELANALFGGGQQTR